MMSAEIAWLVGFSHPCHREPRPGAYLCTNSVNLVKTFGGAPPPEYSSTGLLSARVPVSRWLASRFEQRDHRLGPLRLGVLDGRFVPDNLEVPRRQFACIFPEQYGHDSERPALIFSPGRRPDRDETWSDVDHRRSASCHASLNDVGTRIGGHSPAQQE